MSLQIHRAERADRLVDALADVVTTPLADPFATEVVAVPTPGVERWLSQRLSLRLGTSPDRNDGVCAGIGFPTPRRLVNAVLDGTGPADAAPDPWRPQRAVWPLLHVLDGCRGEAWADVVWSYLGFRGSGEIDEVRGGRRWTTAHHLAGLFASYAASRPTMLRFWSQGLDFDAAGRPLPVDRAWQAELWRRLRTELGSPDPVERVDSALSALAAGVEVELPERLSVFGATRIDRDHLRILVGLAADRDVHLWLPHPSPDQWRRITAELTGGPAPRRRAEDHSEDAVRHRLLAYLGRDSRELQLALVSAGAGVAGAVVDSHVPDPVERPATLLGWLQRDLADNAGPAPLADRPVLDPDDDSVRIHASHGPDRQVEVLREVLVGLLSDDATLEPRDIIVMCPDIETFAPVVAATFGLDTAESEAEHPGHRLRVRLADRSLRQTNPLLAIVARLVTLAESRMPASTLLDLCATPPVARKFGFRTDDLERLHDLVVGSGVRWGLDAAHRARYGMGDFAQNTWAAGLERMLLGVAMDETGGHFIGTTLPLDDVDSGDVDLVGRLAECLSRVQAITAACADRRPLSGWVALFTRALDQLTTVPPTDQWQVGHAYAELGRLADDAAPGPGTGEAELGLTEVSALLAETFRGRATRANFRTGTLTMCTMLPMRSVPHRVVCLLGLDDGVFPRSARLDGDDVTELDAWVGDRDRRSEDRQLLLDAIMSAEERLVVIYAGMDPRSGKPTAPAVPVGELLEALDLTAVVPDGRSVRAAVTIPHPLQPFDERNFVPDALVAGRPFSFDRAALRGVRAAHRPRPVDHGAGVMPVLAALGADWSPSLADLIRFLNHPAKALLRDRAGLTRWRDQDGDEQIPVDLDGLERWKVGDRLLRDHLLGQPLDALRAAEWRRGSLPPRVFGARVLDRVTQSVAELADAAAPHLAEPADRHDVVIALPGPNGDRLTGSVTQVHGNDLVRVSFSRLSAKARLQSWVELLALTAARPDRDWRAITIGTGGRSVLGPVPPRWAAVVLADLVDLQRTGLSEPIPFAPRTSYEYAARRRLDRPIEPFLPVLERAWAMERDEAYEQFFGVGVTLVQLLAQPTREAEIRGPLGEPNRFGTLARRVFQLLLDSEELR